MAAPRSFPLLLAALLALGAAGCRGATPQPVARAEQPKETKAPAATPSSPQAPEPSAPAAPPPRQGDAAPVVVDPGVDGRTEPQTLVEASRAEKERRAGAGKPVAVINDKTLPRYASKGQITVADPKKDKKRPAAAPAAAPAVKDEQYWRGRARELRGNWKQAADEVKDLEQKSTALRQKFYSESDTFLRDTQIKPDWDRVLDRLRQARQEVETAKQELATFLEEGRSAGALPGWLDEGIEDEPADEAAKKKEPVPAVQSIEPPVIDNDAARTPPPGLTAHGPEAPR
jgi:hypothetical protein